MDTEMAPVMVDDIPFPPKLTATTASRPLSLLAHGITDLEIHYLQIKFTAIGVYMDTEIVGHLQQWKGKTEAELAADDDFFEALVSAAVDKMIRVVVIKEIKGSQYGSQLEEAVREKLAAADKYEEEEEAALEQITNFFRSKFFKKDSLITYYFPPVTSSATPAQIVFKGEGGEEKRMEVENSNVVEMIKKWYLGGSTAISPSTIASLANFFSTHLSI